MGTGGGCRPPAEYQKEEKESVLWASRTSELITPIIIFV